MRRPIVYTAGLMLAMGSSVQAATALDVRRFEAEPVTDILLASIRGGTGFSAQTGKMLDSAIWQQLGIIRGTGREMMDNWWTERNSAFSNVTGF